MRKTKEMFPLLRAYPEHECSEMMTLSNLTGRGGKENEFPHRCLEDDS